MYFHHIEDQGLDIYWTSLESQADALYQEAELTPGEMDFIENIASDSRKIEWLQIRALLNHVFGQKVILHYTPEGKPFLKDFPGIELSVSHSKTIAAIALSKYFEVGIDVETIHPKMLKIADKFIHPTEQVQMDSLSTVMDKLFFLTIIWTAKEALFKIIGKDVEFKKDVRVREFELQKEGTAVVEFFKDDIKRKFLANFRTVETTSVLLWIKEKKVD